jgi:hypothetical protein
MGCRMTDPNDARWSAAAGFGRPPRLAVSIPNCIGGFLASVWASGRAATEIGRREHFLALRLDVGHLLGRSPIARSSHSATALGCAPAQVVLDCSPGDAQRRRWRNRSGPARSLSEDLRVCAQFNEALNAASFFLFAGGRCGRSVLAR